MDRLLDDVVAGEPGVVVPVALLVLHVAGALLSGLSRVPDPLAVVGRLDGPDVADGALEDLLHRGASGLVVAPAEAVDDREALVDRVATRLDVLLEPGRVDGHRLLDEGVLALRDGVAQVHRAEVRRGRQEGHVAGVDDVLVGVEADELGVLGDLDAVADGRFLQGLVARLQAVAEEFAHGDEPAPFVGRQCLFGGAGPSAAAADQADLDRVAAGGVGDVGQIGSGGDRASGGGGIHQEDAGGSTWRWRIGRASFGFGVGGGLGARGPIDDESHRLGPRSREGWRQPNTAPAATTVPGLPGASRSHAEPRSRGEENPEFLRAFSSPATVRDSACDPDPALAGWFGPILRAE